MRPRRIAAENGSNIQFAVTNWLRFNEAAANRRGKPPDSRNKVVSIVPASMRPRRIAAENFKAQ
jgi:hypothetical protein